MATPIVSSKEPNEIKFSTTTTTTTISGTVASIDHSKLHHPIVYKEQDVNGDPAHRDGDLKAGGSNRESPVEQEVFRADKWMDFKNWYQPHDLKALLAKYHSSYLMQSIRKLRREEYGLDTIILCDGGHVKAHCCILACTSTFLKSLLVQSKDFPCVISVPDISITTMEDLVTCIYCGSLSLTAQIIDLIEAAKLLGMESLVSMFEPSLPSIETCKTSKIIDEQPVSDGLTLSSGDLSGTITKCDSTLGDPYASRDSEKSLKRKGNRLEQILYKKLTSTTPSNLEGESSHSCSSVSKNHGILGELLTKTDTGSPLVVSYGYSYDSTRSNAPLNLSKAKTNSSNVANFSFSAKSINVPPQKSKACLINHAYNQTPLITSNFTSSGTYSASKISSMDFSTVPSTLPAKFSNFFCPVSTASFNYFSAHDIPKVLTNSSITGSVSSVSPIPAYSSLSTSNKTKLGAIIRNRHNIKSGISSKNSISSPKTSVSSPLSSTAVSSGNVNPMSLFYSLNNPLMTPQLVSEVYEQLKQNPHLASSLVSLSPFPNMFRTDSKNFDSLQTVQGLFSNSTLKSDSVGSKSDSTINAKDFVSQDLSLGSAKYRSSFQFLDTSALNLSMPFSQKVLPSSSGSKKSGAITSNHYDLSHGDLRYIDNSEPNITKSTDVTEGKKSCNLSTPDDSVLRGSKVVSPFRTAGFDDSTRFYHNFKLKSIQESFLGDKPQLSHSIFPSTSSSSPSVSTTNGQRNLGNISSGLPSLLTVASAVPFHYGTAVTTVDNASGYQIQSLPISTVPFSISAVSNLNSVDSSVPSCLPPQIDLTLKDADNALSGCMTPEIDVVGSPSINEPKLLAVDSTGDIMKSHSSSSPSFAAPTELTELKSTTPDSIELIDINNSQNVEKQPKSGSSEVQLVESVGSSIEPSSAAGSKCSTEMDNECNSIVKKLFQVGHMGRKRKGCGDCEGCQVLDDCGACRFCRDKAKFGGPNRLKQVCKHKRCVHLDTDVDENRKRKKARKLSRCGTCDSCQRTSDCGECYTCLNSTGNQQTGRRKICEMRVCDQLQFEEIRASLLSAEEPSPYSTDSLISEGVVVGSRAGMASNSAGSGTSSPTTSDSLAAASLTKFKMKLSKKAAKKLGQPYGSISPSKVRTKYYCGECPGCLTTTPCGNCLYCEDMPKFGGPGRYRQKCVKQLCVYHPRLQALKLSNRGKMVLEDLSHEAYYSRHASTSRTVLDPSAPNIKVSHSSAAPKSQDTVKPPVSDTPIDGLRSGHEKNLKENTISNVRIDSLANSPPSVIKSTCWNPFLMDCDEKISVPDDSSPPDEVSSGTTSIATPQFNKSADLLQAYQNDSDETDLINYPTCSNGGSLHQTAKPILANLPLPPVQVHPLSPKEVQSNPSNSSKNELKYSDESLDNLEDKEEKELPISSVKNSLFSCYNDDVHSNHSPCIQKESVSSTTVDVIKPLSASSPSESSNRKNIHTHASSSSDEKEESTAHETVQECAFSEALDDPNCSTNSFIIPFTKDRPDILKSSPNWSCNISEKVLLESSASSAPPSHENNSSNLDRLYCPNFGKQRGNRGLGRARTRAFRSGGRRGRPRAGGVVSRKSERKKTFRYHERFAEDSDVEDGEIYLLNTTVDNWWEVLAKKKEEASRGSSPEDGDRAENFGTTKSLSQIESEEINKEKNEECDEMKDCLDSSLRGLEKDCSSTINNYSPESTSYHNTLDTERSTNSDLEISAELSSETKFSLSTDVGKCEQVSHIDRVSPSCQSHDNETPVFRLKTRDDIVSQHSTSQKDVNQNVS